MQCGRIVIVGVSSATLARLTDDAGCSGRFLATAESVADIESRVTSLLETPAQQPPSSSNLRTLLDNNAVARQITPLVAFFAIYLCVLLITVKSRHAPVYFVSASVAATLIGLVAWTTSPGYIERVEWAEMDSGSAVARFTSILRVIGGGNRVTFDTPIGSGPLQALQALDLMVVSDQSGDVAASVSFDTRLLAQHEFIASGATTMPATLMVEHSGNVPLVTNTGTGKSPPALLAWNDSRYSVPSLTANEDWQPSAEPEPWGTSRAEQLFRQRAMQETTALLYEYSPVSQQAIDSARSYLMVRP